MGQWWEWLGFLSRILIVHLWSDCSGFNDIAEANEKLGKQYVIWEKIIDYMNIRVAGK